jgi:glutamate 5-kinase
MKMANFDLDAVIKIGSMALIRREDNDLDYNIFARLAADLKPGLILVSSGATEVGRLDYMKRNDYRELKGDVEEIKTDYAAQGQSILMENYRKFISPRYSVRQVLVEHSHFNDPEKREHIRRLLFRAANQNAIPIINYNDPVSSEENRKLEIKELKQNGNDDEVVECVDNDETAAVICQLVNARLLILLTSVDGIYKDPKNPATLIEEINAPEYEALLVKLDETKTYCSGASRDWTAGAIAKLKYAAGPLKQGTTVVIANARHRLRDIMEGKVRMTKIFIG